MAKEPAKKADSGGGNEHDRGAKDDWEAIKLVLDEHPSLKQRVLYHIRAMQSQRVEGGDLGISKKQQREDRLRNKNKKK